MDDNPFLTGLIALANYSMQFSRVERITFHPDGVRPETDSDHTVMLQLLATTAAIELNGAEPEVWDLPLLDVPKVTRFALVHDLVEGYAGDTPSYRIDDAAAEEKDAREARALARIEHRFHDVASWMVDAIKAYEAQEVPEARFVRLMDKMLPKVTHTLNYGVTVRHQGDDAEGLREALTLQRAKLLAEYPEFEQLFVLLFDDLADRAVAAMGGPLEGDEAIDNTKEWVEDGFREAERRMAVLQQVCPARPGTGWGISMNGRLTEYLTSTEES